MISKVLQLSTAHVPCNEPDFCEVRHAESQYGWIVWVWDTDDWENISIEVPEWLKSMWSFAVKHGCVMIEFDADNSLVDEFETYDW